ncbi:protein-export membrane protein SecD [Candidatus Gottesmanbacteria bacterium RIFCSPHIGHO2_02_FULL_40_24]|uniref:Protein translocase subunit SecD n=1 Tax=Candidatus Gottesmanbacteria bacterium RIFCSPHIGHO2_01_FULL_40_15 TaxID=1798376 RepID=A0A1F5Z6D2_9BACT|nr:MAG: protein-export membrane protein SecD [Candidatus Gottesmanbacteria bacterium RIFCSPHIGHO2_01_FULL_40_15]OGG18267.1 MAG: protein-export membrane protein SecD [Candidatus Gottesmanbacteria bacterium RIFCSPHIGHO2_02_FULL_40_24]OGG22487.1 MAG: protein-export membrane protein SecD [Candidatus Gottesmanbacteria bacterium RIFCSPLOWO2_01_FULL_40_10]OGG24826.1 MAG: protein-export membrane protein SecD [Candidatus Gottesmanbacteria bacterium RIFCSPHIGHO2_12_FULL_40_13]OGG31653.1 MAG: protein-expo
MKSLRIKLWLIAVITVLAALIDLPQSFPVEIPWGKQTLKRIIQAPRINLNLGSFSLQKSFDTRLGLDLSGGTHLVLQAEMDKISSPDRQKAFDSAKSTIERRINLFGLTEPVVQQAKVGDNYRIIVEIPGVTDINQAIDLIGTTAQLTFREEATSQASEATPSSFLEVWPKDSGLTGNNLIRSQVSYDTNTGSPQVALEFDSIGAKLFEQITSRNTGKTIAIFLDDQLLSAPKVNEPITGGQAVIQGQFTTAQAKELSVLLNAGALPVPLKIVQQRQIGATLGRETIDKSIFAGIIGMITVAAFMVFNYGLLGLVADIALIIYSLIVWAIFKTLPVTLTLAGIAGFILSIGMAVDANILIFERMKEELSWGKDYFTGLKLGFDRAFPSIRDSNISSLITCAILYWFGTGIIRGFAITLSVGIIVSLFSAVTVSRTLLQLLYKD